MRFYCSKCFKENEDILLSVSKEDEDILLSVSAILMYNTNA